MAGWAPAYLYENKQTAKAFLEQELPDIHLVESEATYLLWLDCRELVRIRRNWNKFSARRQGFISPTEVSTGRAANPFCG